MSEFTHDDLAFLVKNGACMLMPIIDDHVYGVSISVIDPTDERAMLSFYIDLDENIADVIERVLIDMIATKEYGYNDIALHWSGDVDVPFYRSFFLRIYITPMVRIKQQKNASSSLLVSKFSDFTDKSKA